MIFDKLSANDLNKIKYYIQRYAPLDQDYVFKHPTLNWEKMAPMDVILAPWAENKSKQLYQLMGEQLIIETEVDYERSITELMGDVNDILIHSTSPAIHVFQDGWHDMIEEHHDEFKAADDSAIWALRRLVGSSSILANNEWYNTTQNIQLPNGKIFRMQSGTKAMRAIRKIAQAYHVPGFQDFCNAHSLILNQKHLKGTLCVSIHPLDYMTMSDNNSNWSSCMSWKNEGAYRQGTVEMMNSPYVVVAYLKAKDDMVIGDSYTWNNKKWRELFIISRDIITDVLGYPYRNDSLTRAALDILKELAEKNCGYKYRENLFTRYMSHGDYFFKDDEGNHPEIDFLFTTNLMYNDTNSEMQAYITADFASAKDRNKDAMINYFIPDEDRAVINYSGPSECMFSGKTGAFGFDEENMLCYETEENNEEKVCACCGQKIHNNNSFVVDGQIFCPTCYDCHTAECALCGVRHKITKDNFIDLNILVLPAKEGRLDTPKDRLDFLRKRIDNHLYICKSCFHRRDIDSIFLKPGETWKLSSLDSKTIIFWATVDMLNDTGLNALYLNSCAATNYATWKKQSYAKWKKQLAANKEHFSSLLTR